MQDVSGKGIFLAELDDDYQELRNLSAQELHARMVCYFLLAPSLIIHPAYIWQSSMAHNLITSEVGDLLRPPFAQLELGNYGDSRDYMARRIERLRRPSKGTRELRQYESHGDQLFEEAKWLDDRFEAAFSRPVSASWRDKKFRDLLYADLGATDLDRVSLGWQLGAFRINVNDTSSGRELAERMQRFVRTAGLVSIDTFIERLVTYGFNELAASEELRRRLLALYYETYTDERTIIPATSKLLFGQVVNPYDSEVFWKIIARLFGPTCSTLASSRDPELINAIRHIKESSDWPTFVAMYFDTLQTVDETMWAQPDQVIRTFDSIKPERSSMFILKKLWQRRRIELSSAAFGAIALSAATSFSTVGEIGASVAGVAGSGFGAVALIRAVRAFMGEYRSADLVRVKATVRQQVDRALSDIRKRDAGTLL
ncbi:MAG: hypothetical protein ABSB01_01140 [Streptosporangiaceae bacterium]|jgi:hypothetical protein